MSWDGRSIPRPKAALIIAAGAISTWVIFFTDVHGADPARARRPEVATNHEPPMRAAPRAPVHEVASEEDGHREGMQPSVDAMRRALPAVEIPDLGKKRRAPAARVARIDKGLASERRDRPWAVDTEAALTKAFVEGGFAGSTVEATDCQTTYCRMRVVHAGWEEQRAFIRIAKKARMGTRMLPYELDDGQVETVAYFVRKQFDTPEHPVRQQD
jgi:hypothetical protein